MTGRDEYILFTITVAAQFPQSKIWSEPQFPDRVKHLKNS